MTWGVGDFKWGCAMRAKGTISDCKLKIGGAADLPVVLQLFQRHEHTDGILPTLGTCGRGVKLMEGARGRGLQGGLRLRALRNVLGNSSCKMGGEAHAVLVFGNGDILVCDGGGGEHGHSARAEFDDGHGLVEDEVPAILVVVPSQANICANPTRHIALVAVGVANRLGSEIEGDGGEGRIGVGSLKAGILLFDEIEPGAVRGVVPGKPGPEWACWVWISGWAKEGGLGSPSRKRRMASMCLF